MIRSCRIGLCTPRWGGRVPCGLAHGQRLADRVQALPEPRRRPLLEVEAGSHAAAFAAEVLETHLYEIVMTIARKFSRRFIRIRNVAEAIEQASHSGSLTIAWCLGHGDDVAKSGQSAQRRLVR